MKKDFPFLFATTVTSLSFIWPVFASGLEGDLESKFVILKGTPTQNQEFASERLWEYSHLQTPSVSTIHDVALPALESAVNVFKTQETNDYAKKREAHQQLDYKVKNKNRLTSKEKRQNSNK